MECNLKHMHHKKGEKKAKKQLVEDVADIASSDLNPPRTVLESTLSKSISMHRV